MCNLLSEAGAVGTVAMEDVVKRKNILELVIAELDTNSTLQLTKVREEYKKQDLVAKVDERDEGERTEAEARAMEIKSFRDDLVWRRKQTMKRLTISVELVESCILFYWN